MIIHMHNMHVDVVDRGIGLGERQCFLQANATRCHCDSCWRVLHLGEVNRQPCLHVNVRENLCATNGVTRIPWWWL
jgi:hypothetical protein